jgi:hypothetical protein
MNKQIVFPFAITVKRGDTGKYTSKSLYAKTINGYNYSVGFSDSEKQARSQVEKHLEKLGIKDRDFSVVEMPDGKSHVAIVRDAKDPAKVLHIQARYWWGNNSYPIYVCRVWREVGNKYEEVMTFEGHGSGDHYNEGYKRLVAMGLAESTDAGVSSYTWREILEAKDYGTTEVTRKKDLYNW